MPMNYNLQLVSDFVSSVAMHDERNSACFTKSIVFSRFQSSSFKLPGFYHPNLSTNANLTASQMLPKCALDSDGIEFQPFIPVAEPIASNFRQFSSNVPLNASSC
jgi:hypothetical protein